MKIFWDVTRDRTQFTCLAVSHSNIKLEWFALVWGCNRKLFMHGLFCPIRLIDLIKCKISSFWKRKLVCFQVVCSSRCKWTGGHDKHDSSGIWQRTPEIPLGNQTASRIGYCGGMVLGFRWVQSSFSQLGKFGNSAISLKGEDLSNIKI